MTSPRLTAERFEFVKAVVNGTGPLVWIAHDAERREPVVLRAVTESQALELERLVGFEHRHLAGILGLVRDFQPHTLPNPRLFEPGFVIAVAEFVPGTSLQEQLATGRILPARAVAWTLRLIELLGAVHARGAVLGHLSPFSVLARSVGRAIAPVVSELVYPALASFCSPERLLGDPPSAEDDVWALSATLYTAITGNPPYAGRTPAALQAELARGSLKDLGRFGLDEPALNAILKRALLREERDRLSRLEALAKLLDAWERNPAAEPELPSRAPPRARPRAPAAPGAATDLLFDLSELEAKVSFRTEEIQPVRGSTAPETPPPAVSAAREPVQSLRPSYTPAPAHASRPSQPPPANAMRSGLTPLPTQRASHGPQAGYTPQPAQALPPSYGSSPSAAPPAQGSSPRSSPVPRGALSAYSTGSRPSVTPPPSVPQASSPISSPAATGSAIRGLARGSLPPPRPGQSSARGVPQAPIGRWLWVGALAAIAGAGIVVLLKGGDGDDVPPTTEGRDAAAPGSPALASQPARPTSPEARDACVLAHFNASTTSARQDLAFACSAGDFRGVTLRLHRLLGGHVRRRGATEARDDGGTGPIEAPGSLGWYELPATAIVRAACCENAEAVDLPKSVGSCEQLGDVVGLMAKSLESEDDLGAAENRFDLAVRCLIGRKGTSAYVYSLEPTAQSRQAFESFVQRARKYRARRR